MSWAWRQAGKVQETVVVASAPTPLDSLLAQADSLRDSRRWAEAAAGYRAVLDRAPQRAPIWVQLGHALKEAADLPGAEAAYRQSLTLAPDTADTHLQLGHVLKLQNRRPAAIAAYAAAVKADRTCTPALTELIALGESWEAEQATNLGLPLLGNILDTAAQLRAALARLEQALPDAAALAAVPPALFQSRFILPPPPDTAPAIDWTGADGDWILLLAPGAALLPGARAWLDWAAAQLPAEAQGFYTDESGPVLKSVYDPEPDVRLYQHSLLAMRRRAPAPATLNDCPGLGHLARILVQRSAAPPPPVERAARTYIYAHHKLAIIIPTRNGGESLRECIDGLRATAVEPAGTQILILDNGSDDEPTLSLLRNWQATGAATVIRDPAPFNWSRLNNTGAAATSAELLLFMNDDVTLTATGWDQILRGHVARPEIGAIGARLDYPDGALQHGGIVFGPGGRAEHEGVGVLNVLPDIAARWVTRRRVAAVTGAFLACRRDAYEAVGGFDAKHLPIWFNDIDFCLKLREAGLNILYEPGIRATHHESRTLSAQPHRQAIWDDSLSIMQQRWGEALRTDPGFNPQFARTGRPFELMMEPSPSLIRAHLLRSARPDPWRVK